MPPVLLRNGMTLSLIGAALGLLCPGGAAHASTYFEDGNFKIPLPNPGGFALVDVGERYGEWRVVGQAGNVAWTSGTYVHDGFNFVAPAHMLNWVNLAGISRTATGLVHGPVPTTVGAPYTLTFYVGNIVDPKGFYGASSRIAVYENSKFLMIATNSGGAGTTTENWQFFSVTFTADAPYTSLAFINNDGPTDMNCGLGNVNFAAGVAASHAHSTPIGARP